MNRILITSDIFHTTDHVFHGAGHNINCQNPDGQTPLIRAIAIQKDDLRNHIVRMLLNQVRPISAYDYHSIKQARTTDFQVKLSFNESINQTSESS